MDYIVGAWCPRSLLRKCSFSGIVTLRLIDVTMMDFWRREAEVGGGEGGGGGEMCELVGEEMATLVGNGVCIPTLYTLTTMENPC